MSDVAGYFGVLLVILSVSLLRQLWRERRERDYWPGVAISIAALIAQAICLIVLPARLVPFSAMICLPVSVVGIGVVWMIDRGPWRRRDA